MNLKKYLSIVFCLILVIASGLMPLKKQDVKGTKAGGTSLTIETVDEMVELVNAFAPRMMATEAALHNSDVVNTLDFVNESKYKNATITMELIANAEDSNYYKNGALGINVNYITNKTEKVVCYLTKNCEYYVVERRYAVMAKTSDEDSMLQANYEKAQIITSNFEIYRDNEQTLVRISEYESLHSDSVEIGDISDSLITGKWLDISAVNSDLLEMDGFAVYSMLNTFFGEVKDGFKSDVDEKGFDKPSRHNGKDRFLFDSSFPCYLIEDGCDYAPNSLWIAQNYSAYKENDSVEVASSVLNQLFQSKFWARKDTADNFSNKYACLFQMTDKKKPFIHYEDSVMYSGKDSDKAKAVFNMNIENLNNTVVKGKPVAVEIEK